MTHEDNETPWLMTNPYNDHDGVRAIWGGPGFVPIIQIRDTWHKGNVISVGLHGSGVDDLITELQYAKKLYEDYKREP